MTMATLGFKSQSLDYVSTRLLVHHVNSFCCNPSHALKRILPLSSSEIIGCFLVSDDKIAKCLYLSREFLVNPQRCILRKAHRPLVLYFKTNHGHRSSSATNIMETYLLVGPHSGEKTPLLVEDVCAFELYRKGRYRLQRIHLQNH